MKVLSAAAVLIAGVCVTAALAQGPRELGYKPSGSYTDGIFRVEHRSLEYGGRRHTIATLYAADRKIGPYLNDYRKNPSNPKQVLFNTFNFPPEYPARTFFYDHTSGQLTRLGGDWYIGDPEPERLWGPGGRFVVITALEDFRALDTRDLHVEELARTLCGDGKERKVFFAGWSPDGNRLAVVVKAIVGQRRSLEQDLFEVDARQWRAQYVASMTGRRSGPGAWELPGEVMWEKSGTEYRAVPTLAPKDGAKTYVKPLPTLCADQGETAARDRP